MFTVIAVVVGIIVVANAYEIYLQKTLPRKVFQQNKDDFKLLSGLFYKCFIPCVYDMRALHEAYEKGLPRLNETQLCKYFSYPKVYEINENDDLIVNEVNLGKAKDCCLLQFGWNVGYGYTTNYGIRYNLIKDYHKGRMVVEDYKYGHDFSVLESKKAVETSTTDELKRDLREELKDAAHDIDMIKGTSESAFKKFKYVLPTKYLALYEDFQKNNYSVEEMEEKLHNLYKESREEYSKVEENYSKNKENYENENKERVGKFWAGYGSAERKVHSNFDNKKEWEANDAYYGSQFKNISLLDKYAGEDKEIEEEYHLR